MSLKDSRLLKELKPLRLEYKIKFEWFIYIELIHNMLFAKNKKNKKLYILYIYQDKINYEIKMQQLAQWFDYTIATI